MLVLSAAAAADAGAYSLAATNNGGTTASASAALTVVSVAPSDVGRLINLSILTPLAASENMTLGTVLGGNGSSEVRVWAQGLIRRGKYPHIGEMIEEFADTATNSPGPAEEFKDAKKECFACHERDDVHKRRFGTRCESCHNAKTWKDSTFNHDADTRYSLRGKHRKVQCNDCHTGHLYKVKLAQDCFSCHKKDDKHKETLGRDCESCHAESGWRDPPRFDHDKTSFPLLGKHLKAECKACHKSQLFKEAPKDCFSCHQKDDKHQGTLGKACADCHSNQTRYPWYAEVMPLGWWLEDHIVKAKKELNFSEFGVVSGVFSAFAIMVFLLVVADWLIRFRAKLRYLAK